MAWPKRLVFLHGQVRICFDAKIDSSLSYSANQIHDAPIFGPLRKIYRPAEAELTEHRRQMSASQQSRSIDSIRFRYII